LGRLFKDKEGKVNRISNKCYSWIMIIILGIAINGCAGSKSMVVRLEMTSQNRDAINLMPFNTTFEREYYSDADQRYNFGFLIGAIAGEINKRSQLYTYTFDDADLINLRTSIINSLIATKHFSGVNDIQILDGASPLGNGLRLYVDFDSMGVSQKIAFICEIKAHAKICDSTDKILVEKEFYIREKGVMTLMAAKNKAIEEFILEIGRLLNTA
jgi:hypothetical protein